VKIEGVMFKRHCAIVVGKNADSEIVFGEVKGILITESRVTFQINILTNIEYSHHLHSFVVVSAHYPSCMYLISHDKIHDIHPYGLYSSPNNLS
jgi:hypothetical protein